MLKEEFLRKFRRYKKMKEVNLRDTFAKKLGMRTTAKKLFDECKLYLLIFIKETQEF